MRSGHLANPDGINTGNPLEITTCPIYIGRLREWYVDEGLSTAEIGARLSHSELDARLIRSSMVWKWLMLAGIPLRDTSSSRKVMIRRNKKVQQVLKENGSKYGFRNVRGIASPQFIEAGRTIGTIKARQITNFRRSKKVHWYTCALPGCENRIRRPECASRKAERHFCCRSHIALFYNPTKVHKKKLPQWTPAQIEFLQEIERIRAATKASMGEEE